LQLVENIFNAPAPLGLPNSRHFPQAFELALKILATRKTLFSSQLSI
jgi:hypothetical protein